MMGKLRVTYECFYSLVIAVNFVNVFLLVTHILLLFLTMLQSGSFKDFLACYQSQKSAASDNRLKIEQRIPYIMRRTEESGIFIYKWKKNAPRLVRSIWIFICVYNMHNHLKHVKSTANDVWWCYWSRDLFVVNLFY